MLGLGYAMECLVQYVRGVCDKKIGFAPPFVLNKHNIN